ncbi:MAG: hypothetical protein KC549_10600, partial [Myxococcales bacterium]|nr:hypothetical protein [Myxococcales bacterium]
AAALDALFEHLTPAMDQGDPKLRILFTPVAMHLGAGHKPVLVASYADTAMRVFIRLIATVTNARIGLALGGDEAYIFDPKGRFTCTDLSTDEWLLALDQTSGPQRRARLVEGAKRGQRVPRADLLAAFAPRAQGTSNEDLAHLGGPVDILVGSEAISVGQNLQDATALLHLDMPWNPMVLEQRIGRVDRRGGGRFEQGHDRPVVDIHYCWTLAAIEGEVQLRTRLLAKIEGALRDTLFDEPLLHEAARELAAARDDAERRRALGRVLMDRQREHVDAQGHVEGTDLLSGAEVDGLRRLGAWREGRSIPAPTTDTVCAGQLGAAGGPPSRWVLSLDLQPRGENGAPLGGVQRRHFSVAHDAEGDPLRTDLDAAIAVLTSGHGPAREPGLDRRAWTAACVALDQLLQRARQRTLAAHNESRRSALAARLASRRDASDRLKTAAYGALEALTPLLKVEKALRTPEVRQVLGLLQPANCWRLGVAVGDAAACQWLATIRARPRAFLTDDFPAVWEALFARAVDADHAIELPLDATLQTWADLEVRVRGATWVR